MNSNKYQINWDNVLSEEAKLKEKEKQESLLKKEQNYRLEQLKKEELEKKKIKTNEIKSKFKKII